MSEDRRKYMRFNVPLKAEIDLRSQVGAFKEGLTWDFSREGLRLMIKGAELLSEADISLNVFVPSLDKAIPIKAKVVWNKIKGEDWEIGLKLDDIKNEDKAAILDYVYDKWREDKKKSYKDNQ